MENSELVKWARKQNWFPAFIENYSEDFGPEKYAVPLDEFLGICNQDSFLDYAFCWDSSPQGHSFWHEINNKMLRL